MSDKSNQSLLYHQGIVPIRRTLYVAQSSEHIKCQNITRTNTTQDLS